MKRYIPLLLLFIGAYTPTTQAQLLTRKSQRFGDIPPKAIFIQLKSELKRARYFEKTGNKKETERVKEEAQRVIQAVKNDFRDHFSFCSVYYFMDTNAALIKLHQWEGILFDSAGVLVPDKALGIHDRYMIVTFGIPQGNFPQSKDVSRITSTGINVFNEDFNILPYEKALRFIYINPHQNLRNSVNQSAYAYESQKYDIYHYPAAAKLQNAFEKYYSRE